MRTADLRAMAAIWELPSLVIVCLLFVRGSSPLPAVTATRPTRPFKPEEFASTDIVLPPEVWYDTGDSDPNRPPVMGSPERRTYPRCTFDLCAENEAPCPELAASNNCSCPGFTLHNTVPLAPRLRSLSRNGSGVVVRWCSPLSYVSSYVVTVGGQQRQVFGTGQRSGVVGEIDHISEVCLSAVNDAGDSEAACEMYYPRNRSLPLTAGLVGGALGLLLLVLLAVLLWRNRKQRKQQASISTNNTAEPL